MTTEGHRGQNYRILLNSPNTDELSAATEEVTIRLVDGISGLDLHNLQQERVYFGKTVAPESIECDGETIELLKEAKRLVDLNFDPKHDYGKRTKYKIRFCMPRFLGLYDIQLKNNRVERLALYTHVDGDHISADFLTKGLSHLSGAEFQSSLLERFLCIATALCRMLQIIHNQGLIHSVITRRNLLITGSPDNTEHPETLYLVGFGYATSYDTEARKPTLHDRKYADDDALFQAPECRDRGHHTAFWFPSDIYSVGALLLWLIVNSQRRTLTDGAGQSLITDKDIEIHLDILRHPPADVHILKRELSFAIQKCRPELYVANENILKILDTCLRHAPEERFSCIEELQDAIATAESATGKAHKHSSGKAESTISFSLPGKLPRFFRAHVTQEINRLEDLLAKVNREEGRLGHFEVYGGRDAIVNSLCRMLATAEEGDLYCTLTLPNYWTDSNLGSNGRFLTMNKHMARKGVLIRRLFLVTRPFHQLPEDEKVVLEWQHRAQSELAEQFQSRDKANPASFPNLYIKVAEVNAEEVARFEQAGSMVGYLSTAKQHRKADSFKRTSTDLTGTVCLNFHSISRTEWIYNRPVVTRQIQKLRYWTPQRAADRFMRSTAVFEWQWQRAIDLGQYIQPPPEHSIHEHSNLLGRGVDLLDDLLSTPHPREIPG